MNNSNIPETIPLDYNFGYFVGSYVLKGEMEKHQIFVSKKNDNYFKPIIELCNSWNIATKLYQKNLCHHLKIYSTLLCRILNKLFCEETKCLSDTFIFSNKECLTGFLDAYFGEYKINKKNKSIFISSLSKNILIDVQQILNTFNIYAFIHKKEKNREFKNNINNNYYSLIVPNNQAKILASLLHIKINYYNKEKLNIILNNICNYEINKMENFIPNEIDGKIKFENKIPTKYQDVLFDKIISIEEVSNTTNYAFDLTVEETRNFNIYNGLACNDTFHSAGISSKSNVTRGVPRIEEILSVTENPKNPSLTVYLRPEDETNKETARTLMYMLEHTRLQEVVKSAEICFDPDDLNTLIDKDKDTLEQYKIFENMKNGCLEKEEEKEDENEQSKWIIRLEIDEEIMLEKNINMDDIDFTLKNSYGNSVTCTYSDYNSNKLVFRIRMKNIIKPSNSKGTQKKTKVNSLDQSDHIYILKNFQDELLQNLILRGIKGINKVIIRKIKDNIKEIEGGVFKKKEIWVLDTVGTNLLKILGLNYIDKTRTFSNDIVEIYNVLGIEAARQIIYNELSEVLEFDGTYINYHHMSLLVDRMTYSKKIISVFRHGINNDDIGVIAKASFEEICEVLLKAARHAEVDTMTGVSANVMVGNVGYYGTASFQILLDMEKMLKYDEINKFEKFNDQEEIEKMFSLKIDQPQEYCSINNLKIDNNVFNINKKETGNVEDEYNPF
jgi:DNA-directed RNA polymerase beta' subunit